MPHRDDAEVFEVLARQPRHKFGIDVVVTERRLVLLQAQAPQPSRNVHLPPPLGRPGFCVSLSLPQIARKCALQRHALTDHEWAPLRPLLHEGWEQGGRPRITAQSSMPFSGCLSRELLGETCGSDMDHGARLQHATIDGCTQAYGYV